VIVVGSQNSSNSQRLKEIALELDRQAYLIDGVSDIDDAWFTEVENVMITAGASAPEILVEECVEYIKNQFGAEVELRAIREEEVHFNLPKELVKLL
jgi:4-hydroxy-3-methylbut-2-enyl diphosphate reductase